MQDKYNKYEWLHIMISLMQIAYVLHFKRDNCQEMQTVLFVQLHITQIYSKYEGTLFYN